ncbi:Fatty acid desaturase [Shimia sp. SK013]|uniref:fatty acid desaturase n=1 Tax=Shimia sp. SK013 TaxID=1389006 RepID=UPI0006B4DBA4|nr:fatty acid desaturase [Shimia sp. SK013]KPA21905.1 Fatty acid desaturase [Shimia sp. SK013]
MADPRKSIQVEWPTLGLFAVCYVAYGVGTVWAAAWFLPLGMGLTILALALHSSLSHEVLHGHPFASRLANEALVFPAIGLFIPFVRFRDTHLAHHKDSVLTDPYDDPETNFLDPARWARMPRWLRLVHDFNNTLLGRLLVGPLLGQLAFMRSDMREIARGNTAVLLGWLLHIPAVAVVVWWMTAVGQMPVWAYVLSAYAALSVLKIRTFLEHQAHTKARGRTVIIDDQGPLAWIFLNNNLHVVHHMHPRVPWYRLPVLFRENRERYLSRNDGYYFKSYGEVFRRYFWRRKDPVPHPMWGEK